MIYDMGEINRAKDRVLMLAGADLTDEMDEALSNLYAIGERHGEAEAECRWLERTESLRELARRATVFVAGDDVDTSYEAFKDALDTWWALGD